MMEPSSFSSRAVTISGSSSAVAAFRLAPAAVLNIVRRVGPEGLEGLFSLRVLGKQAYFAHLVGDFARVFNDDLARLLHPDS